MSEFKYSCPYCDQHIMMPNEYRGKLFECPTCKKRFIVGGKAAIQEKDNEFGAAAVTVTLPQTSTTAVPVQKQPQSSGSGARVAATLFFVWAVLMTMWHFLDKQQSGARIRQLTDDLEKQAQQLNAEWDKKLKSYLARPASHTETREPRETPVTAPVTSPSPPLPAEDTPKTVTTIPPTVAHTSNGSVPVPVAAPSSSTTSSQPAAKPADPPPPPASTNAPGANSLQQARQKYEAGLQAYAQAEVDKITALKTAYISGLQEVMKKVQAKGDLDGVLGVKNESEKFNNDQSFPVTVVAAPVELKDFQTLCNDKMAAYGTEKQQKSAALTQQYLAFLDALEKTLTKQGALDKALEVRKEKKAVSESAGGR